VTRAAREIARTDPRYDPGKAFRAQIVQAVAQWIVEQAAEEAA